MSQDIRDLKSAPIATPRPGVPSLSQVATEYDINLIDGITPQADLADSTAVDVAGIVADHNALLAKLRLAGVLV